MPRQLLPGQRAELFIVDASTAQATLCHSSDTLLFEAPNWSPDGGSLVINGGGRLFRLAIGADGVAVREPEQLELGGMAPVNNDHVLSPDGLTAYVSSEDGHIHAVDMSGGGSRRVTGQRGDGFRHYLHGVSPDGRTLAYIGLEVLAAGQPGAETVRTNVYTIPASGGPDMRLTNDEHPDDGAEFSPDGQWIYFNSERGSTAPGHAQLFRMPAAGGTPEQLTFDGRVNWFPHPSPDGKRTAYVSFPPGTQGHPENVDVEVRLLGPDGSVTTLAAVFGGQGTMNVPSWSPDSQRIAMVAYPIKELRPG